jgi:hypothetical protein
MALQSQISPSHNPLALAITHVFAGNHGLNFAPFFLQEGCQVNPMRLLGALALAAGGSLLLSEPLIGQDLLTELTGTQVASLRFACLVAVMLGGFAIRLGVREEKEGNQKGGTEA